MTPEDEMRDEVESYRLTIQALLAFNQHMEYEYKGKCLIAKKLKTSKDNRVTPNEEITPDIIVKMKDFGIVGDVKASLPKNHDYWSEGIKQIEKYDDNLTCWDGSEGSVENHDLIALVHMARSYAFSNKVEDMIKSHKSKFDRKWSVIGFNRDIQPSNNVYMLLKREIRELSSMSIKKMEENFNEGKMKSLIASRRISH